MYRILHAEFLAPSVKRFRIEAPRIARKSKAGQFVIVRVTTDGERIPLTIADADPEKGWISLIVQGVGKTTKLMNRREMGGFLADVAGPLGVPSEIAVFGTVVVIGGGVGTAIAYPTARALAEAGNHVLAIIGGRSREFVILEDELRAVSSEVYPATDDGSYGEPGLVTDVLGRLVDEGRRLDYVLAIGPIPMMEAVAAECRARGVACQPQSDHDRRHGHVRRVPGGRRRRDQVRLRGRARVRCASGRLRAARPAQPRLSRLRGEAAR